VVDLLFRVDVIDLKIAIRTARARSILSDPIISAFRQPLALERSLFCWICVWHVSAV
jgi:hypothetical protein